MKRALGKSKVDETGMILRLLTLHVPLTLTSDGVGCEKVIEPVELFHPAFTSFTNSRVVPRENMIMNRLAFKLKQVDSNFLSKYQ